MKKTVGIDLGTTYTVVSIYNENTKYPVVLKNSYQEEITPSVIFFDNDHIVIGKEAKEEYASGSLFTAAFYKRELGNSDYVFYHNDKTYDAEQLSGMFLKELIKEIEKVETIEIGSAVITVPAYFGDVMRNMTINAGKAAGLEHVAIISEPTSAIIAHGLNNDNSNRNVMVFDLGGGTFDVSIANIKGVDIDILSTNGDDKLGGKDFDEVIVNFLIKKFVDEYGYDPRTTDFDYSNILLHDAEDLKIKLSNLEDVSYRMVNDGNNLVVNMTREEFEFGSQAVMNKTILVIDKALEDAKLDWDKLDEVILIGGSTRMPIVAKFIEGKTGKAPLFGADVDLTVSFGAAIKANIENNKQKGNDELTTIRKPNSEVVFTLDSSNINDVTAHTLGILSKSFDNTKYINSHILLRNSKFNTKSKQSYLTNSDSLELYLLQGESEDPLYSDLIGLYEVEGVTENMQVDVSIKYNDNGVVDVSASINNKDLKANKVIVNDSIQEILTKLNEQDARASARSGNIYVVIDISGSMEGSRIRKAKEALIEMVDEINDDSVNYALITFNNHLEDYGLSNNTTILKREVNNLEAKGGTGGLPLSYINQKYDYEHNSKIIVLTDGKWDYQPTEIVAADNLKDKNFEIRAIGFGSADYKFLEEISSNDLGEKVDVNELVETFKNIGSSIATELKNKKK